MGRKRRKAPKILLHPMFQWIRGKMGKIVYRLSHNGEVSAYPAPYTPVLARRCKYERHRVESSAEGAAPEDSKSYGVCEAGDPGS